MKSGVSRMYVIFPILFYFIFSNHHPVLQHSPITHFRIVINIGSDCKVIVFQFLGSYTRTEMWMLWKSTVKTDNQGLHPLAAEVSGLCNLGTETECSQSTIILHWFT